MISRLRIPHRFSVPKTSFIPARRFWSTQQPNRVKFDLGGKKKIFLGTITSIGIGILNYTDPKTTTAEVINADFSDISQLSVLQKDDIVPKIFLAKSYKDCKGEIFLEGPINHTTLREIDTAITKENPDIVIFKKSSEYDYYYIQILAASCATTFSVMGFAISSLIRWYY